MQYGDTPAVEEINVEVLRKGERLFTSAFLQCLKTMSEGNVPKGPDR